MNPLPCPPEHGPTHARGLCREDYWRWYEDLRHARQPLPPLPPHRAHRCLQLVERAEAVYAELQAASDYGARPTWGEVARRIGVKPRTLDRYRRRANHYRARERSSA